MASETYPDGRVITTATYYAGNPTNLTQYKSHGAKGSIVKGNANCAGTASLVFPFRLLAIAAYN